MDPRTVLAMSHIHRLRCDGCNREVEWFTGSRSAPAGWYVVDGEWDAHGECYAERHACSLDCLIAWANRERRERATFGQSLDLEVAW